MEGTHLAADQFSSVFKLNEGVQLSFSLGMHNGNRPAHIKHRYAFANYTEFHFMMNNSINIDGYTD